jgi:acetoin utilization deacetylase AcuC-like enzyme
MTTALITHPSCRDHDTGHGHPESAARLDAVLQALVAPEFSALQHIEAPAATHEQIRRVHPQDYIDSILERIPTRDYGLIDGDTIVSSGSGTAALHAAGAVCAAVDAVVQGNVSNTFCAVRPPGHHAEPQTAMGFCLFNNIAVGAAHALAVHGLEKVAIVDFDVHHGNGTQAWAWEEPGALFCSTHQTPLYPGTGAAHEKGRFGNVVNVPLAPGSGGGEFQAALQWHILPALERWQPQLIFISAGFDAHADDPLASLNLQAEDFAWVTEKLCTLAKKHCAGRVISSLEGGYDLVALAASAAAHVRSLLAA